MNGKVCLIRWNAIKYVPACEDCDREEEYETMWAELERRMKEVKT